MQSKEGFKKNWKFSLVNTDKKTTVRFAPSPTGLLHIGNARAALINWLFARKYDGKFILRIDDTDLERSKKEYELGIYDDLKWLGLNYDETFKQSSRFSRYDEVKDLLIKSGRLYPCYETSEELNFKRKKQLSKGLPPIYDREALSLTESQKQQFTKEGRLPHWRFLLNHEKISWHDMVRGDVEFDGKLLSDPVLIRADGIFLYSLCSVVDDIDYNITHIIRGEDHVANTATQVQMIEAITGKKNHITFGHTTLLMDHEGKALSKRIGSLSLKDLKSKGIEPMAINSLLSRLGTSMPVIPCYKIDEIIDGFEISSFSRTPPRFDYNDLLNINSKLFQSVKFDEIKQLLMEKNIDWLHEKHWDILKSNIKDLSELKFWQNIIYGDIDSKSLVSENKDFYKSALDLLPNTPWDEDTWSSWTKAVSLATGVKGKQLFMGLRKAITGLEHGPEMKNILPLIELDKIKKRLSAL
jgi:glutamyl-tRNA synthetase